MQAPRKAPMGMPRIWPEAFFYNQTLMKKSALLILWLFAGASWCQAENASPSAALAGYVETVLRHHAGLRAAESRVQAAEAGLKETQYQRLPNLSARSTLTRGDNPVFVFGSLLEQGRFGPENFAIDSLNNPSALTNIKSALDLGVPLFTGLDLTSASRQRELAARQATDERNALAQGVRLKAASAYLEALLNRELLLELDQRLAASREEVGNAKRLKDRGVVLGSDYYAALALFHGLSAWRVELSNQQQQIRSQLTILAGAPSPALTGRLNEKSPALPEEQELVAQALKQRPDLAASARMVEQAEVGAQQAGRTIWPRIDGFASLETNTNDFESNPTNHLFGVAARLPFGDPSFFARRSRAASSQSAALEARKANEEAALLELSGAYHAYRTATESLPIMKEMAASAEESLRLFRPLYRSGRQSILDVLRAEEALAKARAAYWQSLFRLHVGHLQLMAASGALNSDIVQNLSQRLEAKP